MNALKSISLLFCFLIVSACNPQKMTIEKLKEFILSEESGLKKQAITDDVTMDIFYYPSYLLDMEKVDCVDYFIVKSNYKIGSTINYNNSIDFYSSTLICNGDTIRVIDAIKLPGGSTVIKQSSTMLAFKSFLDRRAKEDRVNLIINKAEGKSIVTFSLKDIQKVQKIEIVK